MPETARGPAGTSSHIATAQWQSFEMRMRKRCGERLRLRAEAALAQGRVADAEDALNEARALDSSTPDLDVLRTQLPDPPANDVAIEPISPVAAAELFAIEPLPLLPAERTRRLPALLAIAASLTLVAIIALWGRNDSRTTASHASASPAQPTPAVVQTGASKSQPTDVRTTPADVPSARPPETIPGASAVEPAALAVAAEMPTDHDAPPVPVATLQSLPPGVVQAAPMATVQTLAAEPPTRDGLDGSIPISAPAPVPPEIPPTPQPEPQPTRADETPSVRRILSQYEAAYSSLDAAAAKRVWPSLDMRALTRAFDGLQSQRVSLGSCTVAFTADGARADCYGSAEWTPKIGGGTHTESRSWSFVLRKAGGQWHIVDAIVR